jgi:hypothetical protein
MPLSVGGAAVAEPEELLLAAGQGCGDVGEAAAAGDLDFPARARVSRRGAAAAG